MTYTLGVAASHDRLTLYVPKDLQDAMRENLEGTGISLSQQTRYLYAAYLSLEAQGQKVNHSIPAPETRQELYEVMGRQFHRLALISINLEEKLNQKEAMKPTAEEKPQP